jgi:hypothetical protein
MGCHKKSVAHTTYKSFPLLELQTIIGLRPFPVASVRPLKPELMMNISAHFISTKTIAISCAIAALAVTPGGKAYAATIDYSPQFKEAESYSTTISANNDLADIYYPKPNC